MGQWAGKMLKGVWGPQNSPLDQTIFRIGVEEKGGLRPLFAAFGVAVPYVVFVVLYIIFSSEIAAYFAHSVEELSRIEQLKGLVFAAVSGAGIFFLSFLFFRSMKRRDETIIQQYQQLVASERLVTAGLFSASVSHDVNNLMSIIVNNVKMLELSKSFSDTQGQCLVQINEAARRLVDLNRRLMEAGRGFVPGDRDYINLSLVVRDAVSFAGIHQKVKRCTLESDIDYDVWATANALLIGRMLMNLILNAADATEEVGHILVRLRGDLKEICIEVHDDGSGIPEEIKPHIFDPFFTSKMDGNGLGLMALKTCAMQHGGSISLPESPLGGACFRLVFPR